MGHLAAAAGPPTLLSQRFFREKVKWVRKKKNRVTYVTHEVSRSLNVVPVKENLHHLLLPLDVNQLIACTRPGSRDDEFIVVIGV